MPRYLPRRPISSSSSWYVFLLKLVKLSLLGLDSHGLDCEDCGGILAGEWSGGLGWVRTRKGKGR